MSINRDIRAVMLDLDGTLLDTKPDLARAHNHCLRQMGFPQHPESEYCKFMGGSIITAIELACPSGTPHERIMEYYRLYLDVYPEMCTTRTRYFPGVEEFLSLCVSRGTALAVLSNKTEFITQKIITRYFPELPFSLVWGNNDVRPLKPEPEAGYEAARVLGLGPEQIAYVGDSNSDIFFARNCGMLAVGVSWGYRSRKELEDAGADLICDHPEQLSAILNQ